MIPPKTSLLLLASVGDIHSAQTAATDTEDCHIHDLLEEHGLQKPRACHPSALRAAQLLLMANTAGRFVLVEPCQDALFDEDGDKCGTL